MTSVHPWHSVLLPIRRPIADHRDAEIFGAELLAVLGFTQVGVTRLGTDGGIDVTSDEAVAQVKYQKAKVGRPDLQRLVGACGGKRTVFLSLGGFSRQAIAYANAQSMALFCFSPYGDVASVNAQAIQLVNALDGAVEPATETMVKIWAMASWYSTCAQLIAAETLRITSYTRLHHNEQRMVRRVDALSNSLIRQIENLDRLTCYRTHSKRQEHRRQQSMLRATKSIKKNTLACATVLGIPLPAPPW